MFLKWPALAKTHFFLKSWAQFPTWRIYFAKLKPFLDMKYVTLLHLSVKVMAFCRSSVSRKCSLWFIQTLPAHLRVGKKVFSVFPQTESVMDFKTYFTDEALINDCHEGAGTLLTANPINLFFSRVSTFLTLLKHATTRRWDSFAHVLHVKCFLDAHNLI